MTEMVVNVPRPPCCGGGRCSGNSSGNGEHVPLLELIITAFKKSIGVCRFDYDYESEESKMKKSKSRNLGTFSQMEIGWPTDVKHLSHVTFDKFNGFLGLPVEFQLEIPNKVPSASVTIFGVSAESMQCSYDSRGNSVPTILLLMQKRLYAQGGLKAEGIFRINPENSQEEHLRKQLNRGTVPEEIEVHCLAGLIKAWFRELPGGILDGLSPDEVLQCNTEDEWVELVKKLKPTETALLNWAIELMSDVSEQEDLNKMNARNIAMVFAPNMTQMSDPLTALMHAVQVTNMLKTLITKTLREREEITTWGPQSDEEFDHLEEMQTSCELRRQVSSEDEEHEYDRDGNTDNEVGSLSELEENFLNQVKENKTAKDRFKKALDDLVTQHSSPSCGFENGSDLSPIG